MNVDTLVREAQNGNLAAFDRLVAEFNGLIFNLAYRMSGNAGEAEELTQDVFVQLFRSIGKYRWRSKFSTWLYTLAMNSIRSGHRKLRRIAGREIVRLDHADNNRKPLFEIVDLGEQPGERMMRAELREQVELAIASLPDVYRPAIVLRDLQGLAYEEIATILGCSVGTVKSRLARARVRVKDQLMQAGDPR